MNMNIGAFFPATPQSTMVGNIGADIQAAAVIHQVSGTCAAVSSGDLGVLLRDVLFSGSGDGDSTGTNGPLGFGTEFFGSCYAQSGAHGLVVLDKNLVMSGGASSAGSASGSIWIAKGFVLNDTDYRIQLVFDPDKHGILITRTNVISGGNDNIWYDLRTKGFYPEVYQDDCRAFDALYYSHSFSRYKGMIVAGADGYLRVFDNKATNDTGKNTDEAINSYMYTAPFRMNDEEMEGKSRMHSTNVKLA